MRKTNQYPTRKHTHHQKREDMDMSFLLKKQKNAQLDVFVFSLPLDVFFSTRQRRKYLAPPMKLQLRLENPTERRNPGRNGVVGKWIPMSLVRQKTSFWENFQPNGGERNPYVFFCFCRVYYVFREIPWGLKKRCVFFCLGKMLTGHVFKVGLAGDFLN